VSNLVEASPASEIPRNNRKSAASNVALINSVESKGVITKMLGYVLTLVTLYCLPFFAFSRTSPVRIGLLELRIEAGSIVTVAEAPAEAPPVNDNTFTLSCNLPRDSK